MEAKSGLGSLSWNSLAELNASWSIVPSTQDLGDGTVEIQPAVRSEKLDLVQALNKDLSKRPQTSNN